jgi:hypothetical protein
MGLTCFFSSGLAASAIKRSENRILEKGAIALAEALQHNRTLEELFIGGV